MPFLYREIFVWRPLAGERAVCYACFERLDTGQFCVLQADILRLPLEQTERNWQRRNQVELIVEGQLENCTWQVSLKAAIEAHDILFENIFD